MSKAPMTLFSATTSDRRREDALTDLQRSVLLTVLYADLFDFPLTEDEIRARLVLRRADADALRRCVLSLTSRYLVVEDSYIALKGREHLFELRRRRRAASVQLWPTAHRYAAWLSRIPYVRMVAVSGSLAVGNAQAHSDVDLFCVTDENRMWMVRLFIVALSKLTRLFPGLFPRYLCPNYILARGALELRDRNLFTAHEVTQVRPLYGARVYAEFLRANEWVASFLPFGPASTPMTKAERASRLRRLFESAFAGSMGDRIDQTIFAAFRGFYRFRARRRRQPWSRLEPAYQRNSYTVPEGGYALVVRRLFAQRAGDRLASACFDDDLRRLFPGDPAPDGECCYDWIGLFRRDYCADQDADLHAEHNAAIETNRSLSDHTEPHAADKSDGRTSSASTSTLRDGPRPPMRSL